MLLHELRCAAHLLGRVGCLGVIKPSGKLIQLARQLLELVDRSCHMRITGTQPFANGAMHDFFYAKLCVFEYLRLQVVQAFGRSWIAAISRRASRFSRRLCRLKSNSVVSSRLTVVYPCQFSE